MRKFLLALTLLAIAVPAFAQHSPACIPQVLPEPTDGHLNGITHHIYHAPPPSAEERWGKLTYPIGYAFPSGATSAALIWLFAETHTIKGWEAKRWGHSHYKTSATTWAPLVDSDAYVVGQSGAIYKWVPGGIRFVWYPVMPNNVTSGEPIASFRVTADHPDDAGPLEKSMSTPLHYGESGVLGVNVLFPYLEPIRVYVALHVRRCE